MLNKIAVFDFAVLSKLYDLSERYGLKPYEWDCSLDTSQGYLHFVGRPPGAERGALFDKMTAALGVVDHRLEIDDGEELFDRLDKAIRTAPRARVI